MDCSERAKVSAREIIDGVRARVLTKAATSLTAIIDASQRTWRRGDPPGARDRPRAVRWRSPRCPKGKDANGGGSSGKSADQGSGGSGSSSNAGTSAGGIAGSKATGGTSGTAGKSSGDGSAGKASGDGKAGSTATAGTSGGDAGSTGAAGESGGAAGSSGGGACNLACVRGKHCELVQVQCIRAPCPPEAQCVDDAKAPSCGGIAARPCPGMGSCVDDPSDSCDPKMGGADCGGICSCDKTATCEKGHAFNSSPDICACEVATGPQCGKNTCPADQECCNASCGTCVPPGEACTQIACQ